MVNYESVKVTINALGLAEVILDVVVQHHGLSNSIITDWGLPFTLKFWSLLCYLLKIKWRLSITIHPQTDGQTERQNSTIEVYLRAFINFKQNNWARLLLMAEFAYNNTKNASTSYTPFELNCGYYPYFSYKENVNLCSKSKSADDLANDMRELMIVYWENLQHAQNLQKRAYDKNTKPRSYAFGDKVGLNSKYIKIKRNQKLEAKFFGLFWVLYPVWKQAYKLKLPKKWRIHDVFHVSLLEQNTTRKRRVDKTTQLDFKAGDNEKYEVEGIRDSAVYARESEGHLLGLYYLVSWKKYLEEENT